MKLKEIECGNCGAPLPYVEGVKLYKCEYCGTATAIDWEDDDEQDQPATVQFTAPAITIDASEFGNAVKVGAEKATRISLGCVILGVILIVGVTIAAGVLLPTLHLDELKQLTWDGTTPLVCNGNQVMNLKNKSAAFSSGPAVTVTGNCRLTCEHCKLGGNPAIEVSGNGKVTCHDCELSGPTAAVLGVNGKLKLDGGSLSGAEAGARIKYNGELEASSVTITGRAGIDATEGVNPKISLHHVTVNAGIVGLNLVRNAKLQAVDTNVKAATGIRTDNNVKVSFRGGSIQATSFAIDGSASSFLEFTDHPKVTGKIKTTRRVEVRGL